MDIAKLLEAMAPPVKALGQGLLTVATTAIGSDVAEGKLAVPVVTVTALVSLGVLLWMLANLADSRTGRKAKKVKRKKRR